MKKKNPRKKRENPHRTTDLLKFEKNPSHMQQGGENQYESNEEDQESREEEDVTEGATLDVADIQHPIPFRMGVTPVGEEVEQRDELQTWYEETSEEPLLQARGSTDPPPSAKPKPRSKPIKRDRSPRNQERQVARSITNKPKAKVHWNLQGHGRTYRKGMSPEQMRMEWDLHEPDVIQVRLDHQQEMMEEYPKWHAKWSLLMDPVGKGMAEVMAAIVQHVRTTKKEMKTLMKTILLDPLHMANGYAILSES